MLAREPCLALCPFVAQLWATGPASQVLMRPPRERVLRTGCAHLVFRPDAPTLHVFDLRTRAFSAELTHCVLIRDPFGHEWDIGHSIERVSHKEMHRRYTALFER
jgi:hypothetical protein